MLPVVFSTGTAQFTNSKLCTNHQKMVQNKLQLVVSATQIKRNAAVFLAYSNGPQAQRIMRKPFSLETTFSEEFDQKIEDFE